MISINKYGNTYEMMYDKLSNNKLYVDNPELFKQDWETTAKSGRLDTFINLLSGINNIGNLNDFKQTYKWGDFGTTETRLLSLYNEIYKNENVNEIIDNYLPKYKNGQVLEINKNDPTTYDLEKINKYEYNKRLINENYEIKYSQYLQDIEQERKNERNAFDKHLATIAATFGEFGAGFFKQIDNLSSTVYGLGKGFESAWKNESFAEGYVKAVSSKDARFVEQLGLYDALDDFERRYTYMKDLNGNYTNVGKYLGGISSSLGQMLPSLLITKGLMKTNIPTAAIKTISAGTFYTGITTERIRETYNEMALKGASVTAESIMNNAISKSIFEYGIEIVLGKVLGGSVLDDVVFGRTAKQITDKTLTKAAMSRLWHNFYEEGLEEVFQDTATYFVDKVFSKLVNQSYGVDVNGNPLKLSYQSLMDAFVIGGLTSIVGSAKSIISTKKEIIGYKTDNDGNLILDKKGKPVEIKLNKLASWEYGLDLKSFVENSNYIINMTNKLVEKGEWGYMQGSKVHNKYTVAMTEMYAAYRMLASVYSDIGEERFKHANEILNTISQYEKQGRFDKITLPKLSTFMAMDSVKSLREQLQNMPSLARTKFINKLKEAETTNIVETMNRGEINALPESDTKTALKELVEGSKENEVVAIVEGNNKPINESGIIAISKEQLNTHSTRAIYASIAEQTLVENIINEENFNPYVDKIFYSYKEWKGNNVTKEEAIYAVIFNSEFYTTMLNQSTIDMYNFLTSIIDIEKTVVKEDIKTEEYKNKLNLIINNMKKSIIEYLSLKTNIDDFIYKNNILNEKEIQYVRNNQYTRKLYVDIINNGYENLSEDSKRIIDIKINSLPMKTENKERISDNIKSSSKSDRTFGIDTLDFLTNNIFTSKYNGKIYMPQTSIANGAFNGFLKSLNLTIDKLRTRASDSEIKSIIEMFGKFTEDNLIMFRQKQFEEAQDNYLTFRYDDKGKIGIFVKETGLQTGYYSLNSILMLQNDEYTFHAGLSDLNDKEFLQNPKFVTPDNKRNEEVRKLLNNTISPVYAATLSINDVIMSPNMLRDDIKNRIIAKYNKLNSITTYLYLRETFLDIYENITIIVLQDGTFAFGNVKPMIKVFKSNYKNKFENMLSKLSDNKIHKLKEFNLIKDEYLTGRLKDINIKLFNSEYSGMYEYDSNTILLNNDYEIKSLSLFTLLHEFQHAIQHENNMNLGNNIKFIDGMLSKYESKLINSFIKNCPELFEFTDTKNKEDVKNIIKDVLYYATGEIMAYGYEASTFIDFYPVVVSHENNKIVIKLPWGDSFSIDGYKSNSALIYNFNNKLFNLTSENFITDYIKFAGKYDKAINEGQDTYLYNQLDNMNNKKLSIALENYVNDYILNDRIQYKKDVKENITKNDTENSIYKLYKSIIDFNNKNEIENTLSFEAFKNIDIPVIRLQKSNSETIKDDYFVSFNISNINEGFFKDVLYKTKYKGFDYKYNMFYGNIKLKDCLFVMNYDRTLEVLIEPKYVQNFNKIKLDLSSFEETGKIYKYEEGIRKAEFNENISNHVNNLMPNINIALNEMKHSSVSTMNIDNTFIDNHVDLIKEILSKDFTNGIKDVLIGIARNEIDYTRYNPEVEKNIIENINKLNPKYRRDEFYNLLKNNGYTKSREEFENDKFIFVSNSNFVNNDYQPNIIGANIVSVENNIPFYVNIMLQGNRDILIGTVKGSDIKLYSNNIYNSALINIKNSDIRIINDDYLTSLTTDTDEERFYVGMAKKANNEKKIIYNTTKKGKWIYKVPKLDKEGNVIRDDKGRIIYTPKYDEKTYNKRKVSQKSQRGTNMEKYGYIKKYKQTEMSPSLVKFINNASSEIDETLWNEITKGTIDRTFINEYIYKTDKMSQETFNLINDCFFNNNHINSFEELLDLVDKTPDYTAAHIILSDVAGDKLRESTDTKLYEKAMAIIQSDKTFMNTYLKLVEGFDYWGSGKNRIDIDVDKKGMRYNYLKMYNGTLNEIRHIATIAREAAAFAWNITGKGNKIGSNTINLNSTEKGGMSNVIGKQDNYEEAFSYLDSITDRNEMIDKIMEITSKDIIYKLIAEGKGKNFITTYLLDLRKSYEKMSKEMFGREYAKIVDGKSDEEIEKLFHVTIVLEQSGIKLDKLDEEQLNNMTENLQELEKQIERPAQAIVNNIKSLTRTINNNLAPIDHKRFLADNNDLFFVSKGIIKFNTDKFKDEKGKYIPTAQKELFAVEKRVGSLLANVKAGDYSSDFAKKEKRKLNKEIKKLKAENDILKIKLENKDTKTKVIRVNDDIITVDAEKEIPYALQKLLETEFTKTAKTEVQELSNADEEHIVMNTATFVENNAEFLNSLDQVAVDELIEFFATSSILPNTNKARQYTLTQIYTMTYLLASNKTQFVLTEKQKNILEEKLKFMISAGAAIPSAWRQALKILKPEKIIMLSIARKTGIEFKEDTISKLVNSISKGDIKTINETKKELYEEGKEQFKGKKADYRQKFIELERMFMLSGPGTWIRNQSSNLLITGLNKVNESIGTGVVKLIDKLFPNRYKTNVHQYKIVGTKVSTETQEFIKRELIDNGVFALIKDGLGKYNYTQMSKNTTIDNLAYLITSQIESQLFNDSIFKNDKLRKVHDFIYKMMSDDPYIQRETIRYLGKILTEDNVDLTKGITKEVLEHIADAYLLAAHEFMHKKNIVNLLESKLFEKHPNAYFIYKQIFPFTAASYNWFVEGLNYTPIGLIKSIINFAKLENSIIKIADKRSKGEKLPSTKFTEYIIRKNIGKGVIGSIGMIIGALLVLLKGAGIDEEDEKYKLRIGNTYIDISDIFGTQGIFMGIAFTDTIVREKNGFKALSETLNVIFQDSVYSDFYNLFRYKESFTDFALYVPEQMLNSMIPNFVKTLSSVLNKYKVKYNKGLLGKLERLVVQAIPGIAYAFPHYIDPYTGEKQVAYKFQFLFNAINKLSPIDIAPYNVSDYEKEAIDLGIHKVMLRGEYEVNNKNINLNANNIEKLNKFYGSLNNKDLKELYENKTTYKILDEETGKYKYLKYSKMTDKEKATIIKRIMSDNSSLSKIYILTSEYNYKYYADENEYKKLISLGIKNVYKKTDKLKGFV